MQIAIAFVLGVVAVVLARWLPRWLRSLRVTDHVDPPLSRWLTPKSKAPTHVRPAGSAPTIRRDIHPTRCSCGLEEGSNGAICCAVDVCPFRRSIAGGVKC